MFHGRRAGGRKQYKWQAGARALFGDYFARRSGGAPQVNNEAEPAPSNDDSLLHTEAAAHEFDSFLPDPDASSPVVSAASSVPSSPQGSRISSPPLPEVDSEAHGSDNEIDSESAHAEGESHEFQPQPGDVSPMLPASPAPSSPQQQWPCTSSPPLLQPEAREDPAQSSPASSPLQSQQPKAAEPAQLPASERQRQAIERAREFIRCIVAMKQSGTSGRAVRTQAQLAQELGYNPATLSGFMTGTHRKSKPLLLSALNQMRIGLLLVLERKGFGAPASPQPLQPGSGSHEGAASCAGASVSSCAEGSGASRRASSARSWRPAATAPSPARRPQVRGPPPKAVQTLKLREIKGTHAGGEVHVMALGEPVTDPRWQINCPGTDGEQQLQLRLGFRARHTATAGSLGGRTFEFWLERLESDDASLHGGPLWYVACPESHQPPPLVLRARLRCLAHLTCILWRAGWLESSQSSTRRTHSTP